jgi:phospholipid/cholesterol/gamma-HCH transport system permease protein
MPNGGAEIRVEGATVRCTGAWTVQGMGALRGSLASLPWPESGPIVLDGSGVEVLDTAGVWVVAQAARALERRGREVRVRLRPEHEGLLRMLSAPEVAGGPPPPPGRTGALSRLGLRAVEGGLEAVGILGFLGEVSLAASRLLLRPRRIRWRPVLHNLQVAGFRALPIVGLLSFLLGVVIAYQGAVQLQRYGASIFVADLVGLAMLRELSPLLTAIIVAGRSGSAFAAQIGTMKVTEEIDALRTVGIVPADLLVLPKIAALVVALPLLTVYADGVGILGGMVMARSELGVGYLDFLERLGQALVPSDYLVGVGKAPVFAVIIAVVGCYQGFRVSGDAESVGRRTTVSVVHAIFLVIVVDAIFSVVFSWLGI